MAKFFKFKQAGRACRQARLSGRQAGDTIVEVMAAIAIMGLALGAAYALSSRSFNTAQNTDDRVEALALAQGQIEFLRNLGLRDEIGGLLAQYPDPSTPFCFIDRDANAGDAVPAGDDFCIKYGPDDDSRHYDISITYCNDVASACGSVNVFTVKATWTGAGGSLNNNLTIYYKPPS